MNLHAVALAADSALTVRRWVNGKEQTRYFKGSNKIFQLSNHHPVGLMIFNSASLQGVPWEVIVKEFRAHLKQTSYPTLEGYAEALFDHIRQHLHFFPPDRRHRIFLEAVDNTGLAVLFQMAKECTPDAAPVPAGQQRMDAYLTAELAALLDTPLPKVFPQGTDTAALEAHRPDLVKQTQETIDWMVERGHIHKQRLCN